MNEKREWHQPKVQLLDAGETAGADFFTDDSTANDFNPSDGIGSGNADSPGVGADAS